MTIAITRRWLVLRFIKLGFLSKMIFPNCSVLESDKLFTRHVTSHMFKKWLPKKFYQLIKT